MKVQGRKRNETVGASYTYVVERSVLLALGGTLRTAIIPWAVHIKSLSAYFVGVMFSYYHASVLTVVLVGDNITFIPYIS